LDEFDVIVAAQAREHLQMEGMSSSFALRFRDKLAMRKLARRAEIPCPEFTGVFSSAVIDKFLEKVKFPVIVKPRHEVSGFGIRKCENAGEVWNVLKMLDARNTWRDHPSQFLIERFVSGKVFHVDSVVNDGKVVAAGFSEYGLTPLDVSQRGGVFTTRIMPYDAPLRRELTILNNQLISGFELERGVTHAEFVQSAETEEIFLLEIAVRVGGAYIANVLEQASGFNLWREWAKLELADQDNPYQPPKQREDYAGIAVALANTDHPDTSHYNDKEIVYRVSKPKHVGMIFRSPKHERIDELIDVYTERISKDFLAIAPTREHYDD
jgi:biotin carboxylase